MSFDHPALLWALPLALLPLVAPASAAIACASMPSLPRDALSSLLRWALRGAAVLALAALIVALAGPYRPEHSVERSGTGAEIVLLLDRSRSMDTPFARPPARQDPNASGLGATALEAYVRSANQPTRSKGQVAREILGEFAARRSQDRFAMTVFSTLPIPVLDFTQKPEAIQAAIAAGNIGRGLSETNIGQALQSALHRFEDRPYTGSRILLLVSDGGDHLDPFHQQEVAHLIRKHRVSLYWIYIRSARSPGLKPPASDAPEAADTVPEYFLDRFFRSLGTPYRAYEAEDPQALQAAIDDVDRLENLPITYEDTVPRREVAPWAYGLALACVCLLLSANALERRRWAPADAGVRTAQSLLRARTAGASRPPLESRP